MRHFQQPFNSFTSILVPFKFTKWTKLLKAVFKKKHHNYLKNYHKILYRSKSKMQNAVRSLNKNLTSIVNHFKKFQKLKKLDL